MYGYIYRTINLINGKLYIGKKVSNKFLGEKYLGSGKLLRRSVEKYGKENFKVELLDTAENNLELCNLEKYWISFFNADSSSDYYNITSGGDGGAGPRGNETKNKISNWNSNSILLNKDGIVIKIQKNDLDDYLKNDWQLGYPKNYFKHTETWRQKVTNTTKGKKLMIKNDKRSWINAVDIPIKLSEGWTFYECNPWKYKSKRISGEGKCKYMNNNEVYKLVPQSRWDEFLNNGWVFGGPSHGKGRIAPNKDKKASDETRKKLSESHKGHHNSKESIEKVANAIRGRMVMHKDSKWILVPRGKEREFITNGWLPGRNDNGFKAYIKRIQKDYKKLLEKEVS